MDRRGVGYEGADSTSLLDKIKDKSKKIVAVGAAGVAFSGLVACGNEKPTNEAPENAPSAGADQVPGKQHTMKEKKAKGENKEPLAAWETVDLQNAEFDSTTGEIKLSPEEFKTVEGHLRRNMTARYKRLMDDQEAPLTPGSHSRVKEIRGQNGGGWYDLLNITAARPEFGSPEGEDRLESLTEDGPRLVENRASYSRPDGSLYISEITQAYFKDVEELGGTDSVHRMSGILGNNYEVTEVRFDGSVKASASGQSQEIAYFVGFSLDKDNSTITAFDYDKYKLEPDTPKASEVEAKNMLEFVSNPRQGFDYWKYKYEDISLSQFQTR